jgi:hypothetical protein
MTEVLPRSGARSREDREDNPLHVIVSYGENVRRRALLERRTVESVLHGIKVGEWSELIRHVRSFPHESSQQRAAKEHLPFVLWAGEFKRRNSISLITHAGQVALDIDDLSRPEIDKLFYLAVSDPHCRALYETASGAGVRLIVPVSGRLHAEEHALAFDQVAKYVSARYGVRIDESGSDVCRASFVSYDGRLFCNSRATAIQLKLDEMLHKGRPYVTRGARPQWWLWLARELVPFDQKPDGTYFTHVVLRDLARRLAVGAAREQFWMAEDHAHAAADAWLEEAKRQGRKLSRSDDDYRRELLVNIASVRKWKDFHNHVDHWLRWTRLPNFPETPRERIIFAIRAHCKQARKAEFFLGCRDAARVAGTTYVHASRLLRQLVKEGLLSMPKRKRSGMQAITYQLQ